MTIIRTTQLDDSIMPDAVMCRVFCKDQGMMDKAVKKAALKKAATHGLAALVGAFFGPEVGTVVGDVLALIVPFINF